MLHHVFQYYFENKSFTGQSRGYRMYILHLIFYGWKISSYPERKLIGHSLLLITDWPQLASY